MKLFDRIFGPRREEDRTQDPPEYFSKELGDTYEEFWDGMARTPEGAYMGVAGAPFGKPATDESLDEHGGLSAKVIIDKLGLGPDDSVLEVGVGVGRLAKVIAPQVREYHGTDISSNMIDHARRRCRELDNVFFYHAPTNDLSIFPSAKFDAVFFQVVLIHLDREDAFHYLEEVHRTLKPDGRLWAQFYNLLHLGGWKEFRFAVEHGLSQGGKVRGRVQCYTNTEVRKFIEEAGFEIDEARSHLEPQKQNFDFSIPDLDWEHYLIAVARPNPDNS